MLSLKQELEQRGFLHQYTHEEIFELYEKGGERFYRGVDLSADSMTIGNFCAMMQVFHIMRRGNKAYLLVGGATSTIGNPSGKDAERPILSLEQLEKNQEGIHKQFQHLTERAQAVTGQDFDFTIVNNYDFFKDMNILDFLREVGKYMTVNRMIGKDIVRRRITDPDKSISFAEFTYMLIMGYDFFRLYVDEDVKLQVGGSDERDGILSGIELIHKKVGKTAYGVTNKLILDSTGKKFGKSEGNAIWLDSKRSSPFSVYQYFLNTTDEDVERFLKLFTFYEFDEIAKIVAEHQKDTAQRHGQKKLADYITRLIFDDKSAVQAEKITRILFSGDNPVELIKKEINGDDVHALYQATGGAQRVKDSLPVRVVDVCTEIGLTASNGEAKKQIKAGAIYVNEEKVKEVGQEITREDRINERIVLLRKGKKNYKILWLS